ncbi:hypothetical protein E1293_37535 [Actinomadura darangshiensis]|uniref:CHRD domain-containing protein n=1 Tax=Actinomadura darangshiensis TaxID=705336 RepID=A0A4R5A718_9ACTN|nr:hypothetical protein [Actinomadura darangshiensis]TDD67903.1 hypothetical protein E1293_37535 [Actinomadura darangshiensis]
MALRTSLLAVPAVAGLTVFAVPGTARADGDYRINLKDTMGNDSGSSGTAHVSIHGDEMTVRIKGSGFTPKSPHAQHFHGSFSDNKNFTCPTSAADKDGDGQVTTEEGLPAYGDIMISLTAKGDTSPKSGLAVDRMPKADAEGNLSYKRTIKLPDGAGDKIRNLHIVQHGLDANGNGKYDADALGESGFAKSKGVDGIPEEATNPATCGTVNGAAAGAPPTGGVETGDGSTAGIESAGLFAVGGLALTGAAGAVFLRRRLGTK